MGKKKEPTKSSKAVAATPAVIATNPYPLRAWVEVDTVDKEGNPIKQKRYYTDEKRYLTKRMKGDKVVRVRRQIPELEVLLGDILAEEDKNGISAAKLILAALRKKAVAGDVRAAELLLDRAYGKSKQEINVNKNVKQMVVIAGQKIEF